MSTLLDLDNISPDSTQAGPLPTQEELLSSLLSTSKAALPSKHATRTISSHRTQVFTQAFADRILIIITQMNRIGSLVRPFVTLHVLLALMRQIPSTNSQIQITPAPLLPSALPASTSTHVPQSLFPALPPISASIQLTNLFGVAPTQHAGEMYELYANQVGAIVGVAGEERPILLGIGLKVGISGSSREEEEGEEGVTEEERKCFGEVMEMVKECKVW